MSTEDNLSGFGDGAEPVQALVAASDLAASAQGPAPLAKSVVRHWIQLEDTDEIPPTGQFVGVNGRSYMIRPGEPVNVPQEVIEVLQDAVASVPVIDANRNVIGYRDRLRFPFRYVTAPRVLETA